MILQPDNLAHSPALHHYFYRGSVWNFSTREQRGRDPHIHNCYGCEKIQLTHSKPCPDNEKTASPTNPQAEPIARESQFPFSSRNREPRLSADGDIGDRHGTWGDYSSWPDRGHCSLVL